MKTKTPRRILSRLKSKKKAGQAGSIFLSTPSNDTRIESGAGFSDGIGFQEEHDSDTRHKDGHEIPEPDPADGPVPPVVDPIAFKKVLFLTGQDATEVINHLHKSEEGRDSIIDFIQQKYQFEEYPEVTEIPLDNLDLTLDLQDFTLVYNPDLAYLFVYEKIFDTVQVESVVKEATEETISPDFVKDNAIDFSDDSEELEQNKEETPPEPEAVPEEVPAEEPPTETPPVEEKPIEEPKKDFRKGDSAVYITKDKSKVKGKIADSVSAGSYMWFNFISDDGVVDVWTKDTNLETSDIATEAM